MIGNAIGIGFNTLKKIKWLLRDEFTDDRAAGSVNGTLATDGVNVRTVVDSGNNVVITDGRLVSNGVVGVGDPQLSYGNRARVAGMMVFGELTIDSTGASTISFSDGSANLNIYALNLTVRIGTSVDIPCGSLALSTSYKLCINICSTGVFYYIRGGIHSNWKLLYREQTKTNSINPKYNIAYGSASRAWSHKFVRIPENLWLPTPEYSDNFTGTNGDLLNGRIPNGKGQLEQSGLGSGQSGSNAWVSPAGSISGNALIHTPVAGENVIIDSGFDDTTQWNKSAGITVEGSNANFSSPTLYGSVSCSPSLNLSVNKWYLASVGCTAFTSGTIKINMGGQNASYSPIVGQNLTYTGKATTNPSIQCMSTDVIASLSDFTYKPLALSDLFSDLIHSTNCVLHSAKFTRVNSRHPMGLVSNLASNFVDSDINTHNFVITHLLDTNTIKTEKCVNGVYTSIGSTTSLTYSGGARIEVRIDSVYTDGILTGLKHNVYYNNAFVHTATEVNDAKIIRNVRNGVFNTNEANSVDDYTSYPVGVNGEYNNALDKYTRD